MGPLRVVERPVLTRPRHSRKAHRSWSRMHSVVLLAAVGGFAALGAILSVFTGKPGEQPWVAAAYVPYWDQDDAFKDASANSEYLTDVSPWWYAVTDTGAVVPQDPVVRVDHGQLRELRDAGVRVLPTIANHLNGVWTPEATQLVLQDERRRSVHVAAIVELVTANDFDGIDIDYEDLGPQDREVFSQFLRELGRQLHDRGRVLSVTVHPKASDGGYDDRNLAQDYAAIGASADQVRIMAYDWHSAMSAPGSVAPLPWVESVVEWATSQMPSERIVLGVPLYGYDWGGAGGVPVTALEAQSLAARYDVAVQRDAVTGSSWFTYQDDGGTEHTVWFEDAASADAKVRLAQQRQLGGVFFWRLGRVEAELWPNLPVQER